MSEKRIKVWVQQFRDRPALVLQWIDPDTGRRKSKSAETSDPDAAETARADLESDLNHGRYAEASRMTWEGFRELFEEQYFPNCRPKTCEEFRTTLDQFERLCNPRKVSAVKERTVSAFATSLRKLPGRHKGSDGMMASTVKIRLQNLHTVLKWAEGQKIITACPKFPSVKVPKKRPQPVPAEAFEKLLDKAEGPMKAFLLCGWLAGLRLAEAHGLEWEPTDKAPWVDFGRNRIILPAEMVKAVEDQWVPLDPALKAVLLALPRNGRKVFRFTGWDKGVRVLGLTAVSTRIVSLAHKAGVKLTMRSLRRGFGCRYAGKVSAQILQRLMRHANIQTTVNYYANVDAAVEEAVLGPQCNSSRNTKGVEAPRDDAIDATSSIQKGD